MASWTVAEAVMAPAADWATLTASLAGARVFAQTTRIGFAKLAGFTGVYTYDILQYGGASFGRFCEEAHHAGLLCAPSVGPGYDAARALGQYTFRSVDLFQPKTSITLGGFTFGQRLTRYEQRIFPALAACQENATGPIEIGAPWRVNKLHTSIKPLIGTAALSAGGGCAIAMYWDHPS